MEAPAKINLFLQVGPAGEDGYHPVRTVMQALEACDRLEMELARGEGWFELSPARLAEAAGGPRRQPGLAGLGSASRPRQASPGAVCGLSCTSISPWRPVSEAAVRTPPPSWRASSS